MQEVLTEKEVILQAVARGWCSDANSHKTMDTDLAMAITNEILKLPSNPNLGCATTRELLDEVMTRMEIHTNLLDYRTIDS